MAGDNGSTNEHERTVGDALREEEKAKMKQKDREKRKAEQEKRAAEEAAKRAAAEDEAKRAALEEKTKKDKRHRQRKRSHSPKKVIISSSEESGASSEDESREGMRDTISLLSKEVEKLKTKLDSSRKKKRKNVAPSKKKTKKPRYASKHTGDCYSTDDNSSPNTSGDSEGESCDGRQAVFYRPPMPGDNVSEKLLRDIWNDKYVDFYDLLDKDLPAFTATLDPRKGKAGLTFEPAEKQKISYLEWIQAFGIFKACYLRKFEGDAYSKKELAQVAQDLIAYELSIHNLKDLNLDWYFYDQKFRKERKAARYSFSYPRPDLWAQASARSLKLQERRQDQAGTSQHLGSQKFRPSSEVPPGYCFSFHEKGKRCNPLYKCTFKHWCYICNSSKPHPAYLCGWQALPQ